MARQLLLNKGDVRRINAARTVMDEILKRAGEARIEVDVDDMHALGRFVEAVEGADRELFRVLNVGRSFLHLDVSTAELHNKDEVEA